jgi:hypothetical protein
VVTIQVDTNEAGAPTLRVDGTSELDQLLAKMCESLNATNENPSEDLNQLIEAWREDRKQVETSG